MCFAERYGTSFSIKLEPCTRFWTRFDRISLKVLCVCFSLSAKSLPGGVSWLFARHLIYHRQWWWKPHKMVKSDLNFGKIPQWVLRVYPKKFESVCVCVRVRVPESKARPKQCDTKNCVKQVMNIDATTGIGFNQKYDMQSIFRHSVLCWRHRQNFDYRDCVTHFRAQ